MNNLTNKLVHNFFILLLCSSLLISCKVFHEPISLNEAANNTEKGYYKVTLNNGDEYIYQSILIENDAYFGITKNNNKIIETPLIKSDIQSIQKQNTKASNFSNILGIGVGIGSILLGVSSL
jgi:hypothetical protein